MKNLIGVMQGRLLPKYQGRYQAHPIGYWQDEFYIAQTLNLDCIEFILDFNDAMSNPLLTFNGIDEINKIIHKTGVKVRSVCADYFMEAPIHSENLKVQKNSQFILNKLISSVGDIGVTEVVIPCVDNSSLNTDSKIELFIENLKPVIDNAEKKQINLSLETDLAPKPFLKLLNKFDSNVVTVNYDIGNSAALGYDFNEELSLYGQRITDIHIKDRFLGGGSVVLGQGNADFNSFFKKLKEYNYQGPFIMQAYRDDEGVDIFKKQLNWISSYLEII